MSDLRSLSKQAIPAAIEKAKHYRLLNEPEEAESICLDILEIETEHQESLVVLLLSLTDQFAGGSPSLLGRAREILPRLTDNYERAYYGGLICERQAKNLLRQRGRHSGFVAYEWFQYALEQYDEAIKIKPSDNDDAILRWNTCVRIIDRHRLRAPDPEEREDMGIE